MLGHRERLREVTIADHVLDVAEPALDDIELLLRERREAALVDRVDPLLQLVDERTDLLARFAPVIARDLVGLLRVLLEDSIRFGRDIILILRDIGELVHHLVELLLLFAELVATQLRQRALERARGTLVLHLTGLELGLRGRGLTRVDERRDLGHALGTLLRLHRITVDVLIHHILGHALLMLLELRVRAIERAHLAIDLL